MSFDEQPDADIHGECAAEIAALRAENEALRKQVVELSRVLRGLHDDNIDYQTLNHLGGYDNHWLVQSRAALAATEKKP